MHCTEHKPLVLTTGGAGFIGSHTVVELLDVGYDTVILDNFCNASKGCIANLEKVCGQKLKVRTIDLLDKDALTSLFHEFKFDYVIHFAALKAVGESVQIPLEYYQNNITGFVNLLQVMAANNVKKLVYSSSCTVYGDPSKLPLTEETPTGQCANPYGRTKYIGELILEDLTRSDPEWSVINLRYFNPVGAHKSGLIGEDAGPAPKNIFPCLTKTAYGRMQEVVVFGNDYKTPDGTGIRDYIHVVDLAKGHVSAVRYLSKFTGCKSFNLGTGKGYSVIELIKAMEKASGKPVKYRFDARRGGDIAMAYADTTLAEKELGWKAEKGLPEMCEDAWRWQCNFPDGYPKAAKGDI
ncbi:UDP glucose 4 epimerase [Echinococcus multilocularis]|uniref:UDP-glucose 4-epimerase n=1 Tax=Echinococcus multilocularis TaxID=6211 RepID=A0A068YIL7_ECHMU|nr:UDP glucose 4 epimerase [Echinococcus multilocularis]